LTGDDIARGFTRLEAAKRQAVMNGDDEPWPPDYASFVELCQVPRENRMYKKFDAPKLTDETQKGRARKRGEKELDGLKAMLGID